MSIVQSKRVRISVIGRVFLVYWLAPPDAESVQVVVAELPRARMVAGVPLLFCTYVPEWLEPPAPKVRQLIIDLTPEMFEWCESIHTIHVGESLLATAFRTVARGRILAAGFRGRVFIHGSLGDFVQSKAQELGATASDLLGEVDRLGGGSVRSTG